MSGAYHFDGERGSTPVYARANSPATAKRSPLRQMPPRSRRFAREIARNRRQGAARRFRRSPASIVAVHLFPPLMHLLRFEREGRDRPRLEAAERDRLARHLAVAIAALVDPPERRVD